MVDRLHREGEWQECYQDASPCFSVGGGKEGCCVPSGVGRKGAVFQQFPLTGSAGAEQHLTHLLSAIPLAGMGGREAPLAPLQGLCPWQLPSLATWMQQPCSRHIVSYVQNLLQYGTFILSLICIYDSL